MIYLSCDNMKKIIFLISIFLIGINLVSAKEKVKYVSCIDGDTFKVSINNEQKKIRLLAVDAPETEKENKEGEYYADEASEYTCKRIKKAHKIELEYDPNSDKEDKYGRVLAWVFLDNQLLQSDLVENGYAEVAYLYNNYKYADELLQKQELASAKKVGIWSEDKTTSDTSSEDNKYENIEVVIISILFLIFAFIYKFIKK